MTIWYNILAAVNEVSKDLQSKDMLIDVAIEQVQGLIAYFEKYRETGFAEAMINAKKLAIEMEIDPVFPKKRQVRRKRHFDENEGESSQPTEQSAEESFRVHYFLYIIDQAIGSLKRRFEEYQAYDDIFGFLFTSERLNSMDNNKLKDSCDRLQNFLKKDELFDVDGDALLVELKLLRERLPKEIKTSIDILNYLKRMRCFPTASVAYRILLTIPITVASAERSFSKLKLLKSYLRSTMLQERLNGLALISIESDFLDKIDYEVLIDDFAAKNARRAIFK
ncbi:uncharacterized protein LOC126609131 [Malus sylvestris]|uniref:uncharacterized protein LOC126609131 n=1 Tax=Malus sylvestris TaxID=3752 RepID=UPI0021ABA38B|nr:uncharacterized protein LOC126609131 [Malus sylvestris]